MNDYTRKTKIAEIATLLFAAHIGVVAAPVSVDIDGVDLVIGHQHVQVKVARQRCERGGVYQASVTNSNWTASGTVYRPRSKADLYVFVALTLTTPFDYQFWVVRAAEIAHAKATIQMRDEWRLEKRMDLFRGEVAA